MKNSVAIIDYQAGNLTSVKLAFDALGVESLITADAAAIAAAARVVFPGVGAAGAAMRHLRARGLDEVIRGVAAAGRPFLGICLGTQILLDFSEEDGGTPTLGLLPGRARRLQPSDPRAKVPHMGWNQVRRARPHPLLAGIADGSHFYFVHSYYPDPAAAAEAIGRTEFAGFVFASMLGRGNVAATQFHPEKSGAVGLRLLANFLAWDGSCAANPEP